MPPGTDWFKWHAGYEVSEDRQARLRFVQADVARALDACRPGPISVVSLCAGDGRDLLGVLLRHRRLADVAGSLVETDRALVDAGRAAIAEAGLSEQVAYVVADATLWSTYDEIAPAAIVIIGGVFGNLRPREAPRLIEHLPALCERGAFVVWTRHRRFNDGERQLPLVRQSLRDAGFAEVAFDTTSEEGYSVGMHRHSGPSRVVIPPEKWFEFSGP